MDKHSRYVCGAMSDLATPTGTAATLGVVCCTSVTYVTTLDSHFNFSVQSWPPKVASSYGFHFHDVCRAINREEYHDPSGVLRLSLPKTAHRVSCDRGHQRHLVLGQASLVPQTCELVTTRGLSQSNLRFYPLL